MSVPINKTRAHVHVALLSDTVRPAYSSYCKQSPAELPQIGTVSDNNNSIMIFDLRSRRRIHGNTSSKLQVTQRTQPQECRGSVVPHVATVQMQYKCSVKYGQIIQSYIKYWWTVKMTGA